MSKLLGSAEVVVVNEIVDHSGDDIVDVSLHVM